MTSFIFWKIILFLEFFPYFYTKIKKFVFIIIDSYFIILTLRNCRQSFIKLLDLLWIKNFDCKLIIKVYRREDFYAYRRENFYV